MSALPRNSLAAVFDAPSTARANESVAEMRLLSSTDIQPVKATILIVDDEPNNRFAFSTVLEELEEHIVLVSSGAEALRFLLHNDCAVILLDVNMPDMDGYETAELIRGREKSRQIPIIFVSAINKDDTHVARAYGLGAVDYVFKPVEPVVLKSKITVFVELYKKTAEVKRQALLERILQEENLRVRAEKLEAERALRRAEEQQALIVRSLPIVLYSAGVDREFRGPRFLGERISQLIGFPSTQFVMDADFWVSRIHSADIERVLAEVARIAETGTMSVEYRWRCADGSERFFLDRAVLVRDEAGHPQEIFGSCLDITERRQAEQRLFQSQKMEAVGQLTGGLAHDFNNMLTIVIGNLDALGRALKDSGRNSDRVQMALTGAMSCAELTRRLLAFARRQPLQPTAVDFGHLIRTVTKLLGRTLGEKVAIELHLDENLWNGMADAAQVESALMNLAVNARDAMPEGGTLRIEAKNVVVDGAQKEQYETPGEYVMLAVSDTGCGMAPEVVERAFEPFFTTKKTGQGSGLGLSMVYGFVKQSGGHIRIDSAVEQGTTVRIYLPRGEAPAPKVVVTVNETLPVASLGQGRTVMLVEDDAGVRAVTAALLKELQFNIVEADSGASALQLFRHQARDIDLLFTDVVMPGGVNGIELAAAARKIRPDLPVLLTSGYSESFSSGCEHGELLPKPYREADLVGKLRQLFPT